MKINECVKNGRTSTLNGKTVIALKNKTHGAALEGYGYTFYVDI